MINQWVSKLWNFVAPYVFIGILITIFARGIFATKGGAKAWFELFLMAATILASGYLLWWQIPMLLLALILGTFSAGMFVTIAPQYIENFNLRPDQQIIGTLKSISTHNKKYIEKLSPQELKKYLQKVEKVEAALNKYLDSDSDFFEVQDILNNVYDTQDFAEEIIEEYQQDIERTQQAEEQKRRQAEERRIRQQQLLQIQRKEHGYSLGHPPIKDVSGRVFCPPGYPIKVPMNKTPDGFDSIVWHPADGRYTDVNPEWCYRSIEEAMAEKNFSYRRPKK